MHKKLLLAICFVVYPLICGATTYNPPGTGGGTVSDITDHLTGTPTNSEVDKAPTSDWAYDHENGADPHTVYLLEGDLNNTYTDRSGSFNNFSATATFSPTEDDPNPTTNIFSAWGELLYDSAEDWPWAGGNGHGVGVFGHYNQTGAGAAGLGIGVEGAVSMAAGSLTTGAMILGNLLDGTGTITTLYGVYISDIDTTNISTFYSFYGADSAGVLYNAGNIITPGNNTATGGFITPGLFYGFNTGLTEYIGMEHNDTDGVISTSSGDLDLTPATGVVNAGASIISASSVAIGAYANENLISTGSTGSSSTDMYIGNKKILAGTTQQISLTGFNENDTLAAGSDGSMYPVNVPQNYVFGNSGGAVAAIKVNADTMDLTDDYAFTGALSGPPLVNAIGDGSTIPAAHMNGIINLNGGATVYLPEASTVKPTNGWGMVVFRNTDGGEYDIMPDSGDHWQLKSGASIGDGSGLEPANTTNAITTVMVTSDSEFLVFTEDGTSAETD